MAPGPEAVGNVGLELEDHPSPRPGGGGHKAHKPNVPRPEEGDDQKGHKEDEGGTKVTHQGQAAHTEAAEEDGKDQVSPGKEPVQGGRPGEDEGDLHKLRGLKADGADMDPVPGPEELGTKEHVEDQQQAGKDGHRPAQGDRGFQVPQQHAEHQEHHNARNDADGLGEQIGRVIGCRHREGEGAEEEGYGLHLKGRALHGAVDQVGHPHGRHEDGKGPGDHHHLLGLPPRDALGGHHDLKHRQVPQGAAWAQGAFRHPPAHGLLPLFGLTDGVELHAHAPQVNDVPGFQGGGVGDFFPVEPGAVFGLQGLEFPVSLIVPEQGGVAAGDGGKIQADIDPGSPADGILPMAQVQLGPVGQGEPAPDLFARLLPEQGHEAADDDQNGNGDGHHPQNTAGHRQNHVDGRGNGRAGIWVLQRSLDLLPQLGENRPQAGDEFLHGFLLFSGRQGRPAERVFRGYPLAPGCHPRGRDRKDAVASLSGYYIILCGKHKSGPRLGGGLPLGILRFSTIPSLSRPFPLFLLAILGVVDKIKVSGNFSSLSASYSVKWEPHSHTPHTNPEGMLWKGVPP